MNKIILNKEEQKIYKIMSEIYLENRKKEYFYRDDFKEKFNTSRLNLIKNNEYFISLSLELYKQTSVDYSEETVDIIINILNYLNIKTNNFNLKEVMEKFIFELKNEKLNDLFIKRLEANITDNLQLLHLIIMHIKEHITTQNSIPNIINY